MSEPKWVPGPYVYGKVHDDPGDLWWQVDAPSQTVGRMVFCAEEAEPHLALFAAAPDLYEALRHAEFIWGGGKGALPTIPSLPLKNKTCL